MADEVDVVKDALSFVEKVKVFLSKVGSFLIDRRLWLVGLVGAGLLASGFLGVDAATQKVIGDAVSEGYDGVVMIIAGLGKVAAAVYVIGKLLDSWTRRAPSGLDYKDSY